MNNVILFPLRAVARCTCGFVKARSGNIRPSEEDLLTPLDRCPTCGNQVEASALPSIPDPLRCCIDCGSEDDLAVATITLPDGMGQGRVHLCNDCVSRYDEGDDANAARNR